MAVITNPEPTVIISGHETTIRLWLLLSVWFPIGGSIKTRDLII